MAQLPDSDNNPIENTVEAPADAIGDAIGEDVSVVVAGESDETLTADVANALAVEPQLPVDPEPVVPEPIVPETLVSEPIADVVPGEGSKNVITEALETQTPETQVPETQTPDSKLPDTKLPDSKLTEAKSVSSGHKSDKPKAKHEKSAKPKKPKAGRFTPVGGPPTTQGRSRKINKAVQDGENLPAYAGPASREAFKVQGTKAWVPFVFFGSLGLGLLIIVLNYLGQVLPGAANNWYLLGGIVAISIGFLSATQYY